MPLVHKFCEREGKDGKKPYTDGEMEFLLSRGLIYPCPECHQYHHLVFVSHDQLIQAIEDQVAIVGHTLQVGS